jgi:phenylacetate-CoA ligase
MDARMSERFEPRAIPKSTAEIAEIQRARRRVAVERARRAPFWAPKLSHVDIAKLDDPAEWRKIPLLDKEALRGLSNDAFYAEFCTLGGAHVAEYWRSGGSTGRPLFYPRTHADLHYAMEGFRRTYRIMGCAPGTRAHLSLPLGIHPAGQMWARAGEREGLAMVWAGSGANTPSELQLELMRLLKPGVWMGMSGYALHLANLAEARGEVPGGGTVRKILCTAEPLSAAKRTKIAAAFGAEVYDAFGMTEVTMMGAEDSRHDGFRIWTDLVDIEVLDPVTFEPVPPGGEGVLVVTPLYTNEATPFLRWNTGDVVQWWPGGDGGGSAFDVFARIRHAHRTLGFFKVRGINLNHAEFEDFMFARGQVRDFRVEALARDGTDVLRIEVEFARGAGDAAATDLVAAVKRTFELTPDIAVLAPGTLAKEFEAAVKTPRFADRR